MKRKTKLLYSILCIFIALMTLISCSVQDSNDAANNSDYDKFSFNKAEGGYKMTQSYKLFSGNYEGVLVIPETYQNAPIVEIDSMDSSFGRKITEIRGSQNLVSINSWTFAGKDQNSMSNLTKVIFPNDANLKTIDTMAFYWQTSLKIVVLPNKIEYLGNGVFERCFDLETLVIYNPIPPKMDGDIFNSNSTLVNDEYWHTKPSKNFKVYVPDEAVETYKKSAWNKFSIQPTSSIEHILKEENITSNVIANDTAANETNAEQSQGSFGVGSIIAICVVGVAFIALCLFLIIDHKNKKTVLEKSEKIKSLLTLNQATHFTTLQSKYSYYRTCNSKRQLDNLYMNDYLVLLIDENESSFRNIVQSISSNKRKYNEYISQTHTIRSTATEEFCQSFGFTLVKFLKYEDRVFKRKTLRKPLMDVVIYCKATYTSPQGRNHYWKEQSYNYSELKRIFDNTMEAKAQRQTRQYQIQVERAKMTDSLRYDILKRDNFRCQICGSSAQDGVKLHVDHIIPVSKGGQTVASNLRTLCDRCNMGKSDKM